MNVKSSEQINEETLPNSWKLNQPLGFSKSMVVVAIATDLFFVSFSLSLLCISDFIVGQIKLFGSDSILNPNSIPKNTSRTIAPESDRCATTANQRTCYKHFFLKLSSVFPNLICSLLRMKMQMFLFSARCITMTLHCALYYTKYTNAFNFLFVCILLFFLLLQLAQPLIECTLIVLMAIWI